MLKTLRITSLIVLVLAACGVAVVVFLGFRGDPVRRAILDQPGIADSKAAGEQGPKKPDDKHPLVTQARKFALRLNPPPPPAPPPPPPGEIKPIEAKNQRQVAPPPPPPPPPAMFELLATVRYESDPSRSLVLLRSGAKVEWFRTGEKAGHLTVEEVLDGSAVFSQSGQGKQTLRVPAKEGKSLLKSEQAAVAVTPPSGTPAGVMPMPVSAGIANPAMRGSMPTAVPAVNVTAVPNPAPAKRVRATLPPSTPEEQKAKLEQSIAGIQDIINRQDEGATQEQRKEENQLWTELLNTLKNEKESLQAAEQKKKSAATPPPAQKTDPRGSKDMNKPAAKPAAPPAEPVPQEEEAVRPEAEVEDEGQGAPVAEPVNES